MKLQTVMFSMIIFVELLSLSCERAICYQANAGLLLLEGGGLLPPRGVRDSRVRDSCSSPLPTSSPPDQSFQRVRIRIHRWIGFM